MQEWLAGRNETVLFLASDTNSQADIDFVYSQLPIRIGKRLEMMSHFEKLEGDSSGLTFNYLC